MPTRKGHPVSFAPCRFTRSSTRACRNSTPPMTHGNGSMLVRQSMKIKLPLLPAKRSRYDWPFPPPAYTNEGCSFAGYHPLQALRHGRNQKPIAPEQSRLKAPSLALAELRKICRRDCGRCKLGLISPRQTGRDASSERAKHRLSTVAPAPNGTKQFLVLLRGAKSVAVRGYREVGPKRFTPFTPCKA